MALTVSTNKNWSEYEATPITSLAIDNSVNMPTGFIAQKALQF